jgi:hypothetical protein
VAMTSVAKMPPWYDVPRPTRVRAGPRTDRRSAACTTHVRRDGREARGARASRHHGAREPGEGARPRSAHSLGKVRRPGRRGGVVRERGARGRAMSRRWLARTRVAEPLFEHAKLQNFE